MTNNLLKQQQVPSSLSQSFKFKQIHRKLDFLLLSRKTHCKDCIKPHNIWNTGLWGLCLFGVLFFLVTLFVRGFLVSIEFFCNQIAQSKLPKFENKIYFTYFWNSSGLESGSRFFFHLCRDLSVMSFSPGISGIPMAWANRCAPWSVSSMCFVCRKTRDSLTILIFVLYWAVLYNCYF